MAAFSKVQKASTRLVISSPFFATLFMTSKKVETKAIPTARTDGVTIEYNPDFLDRHTLDEIGFIFCHEVLHTAADHMNPKRVGGRDPMLWNIACDYRINWLLKAGGMAVPPSALIEPEFAELSEDQIYRILEQRYPPTGDDGKAGDKGKSRQKLGGGSRDRGSNLPEDMVGHDLKVPEGMSQAEQQERSRQVQQRVAQAACAARLAGKMSAELERFVGELLDSKVPWQEVLADKMKSRAAEDESWSRRNRRFQSIYLPGKHSMRMGPIVIMGDTSGSIGNDELKQMASETAAIGEQLHPENIRVLWGDTKVCAEELYEDGDIYDFKPAGGGGTDMRVLLAHAEQYEPEVAILFTDGYTPWPAEEPPYDLIVCCTTGHDVPVGQVIRM